MVIGSELAGYRIERLIGRGGMGEVYLAEHMRLKRKAALKLIAVDLAQDERFRERFLRESELAAALDHPNVIPIYDAGEAGGLLYLAMRYVEGTDLKSLIEQEGPLPGGRVASILSQAAGALDAAHAKGLIHRDVKPGNILITPGFESESKRDRLFLSDFGLTKRATSDSGITATGQFIGTLDYAAPEQFEGRPLDARTDVYSLGCVLYECLTGEVPFKRDNEAALVYAHLLSPPPKVTDKRLDLPPAVDAVASRAMAKRPEERFPTAGDLAAAARVALGVREAGEGVAGGHPPSGGLVSRHRPTGMALMLGVSGVVALVAALVTVFLVRGRSERPPPAASAGGQAAIDSVVRLNPFNLQMKAIRVGKNPTSVASGEGSIWVTNFGSDSVSRIDPVTNRTTTIRGVGQGPEAIALGGGVPDVWVTTSDSVARIDPATNSVVKIIKVADCGAAGESCTTGVAVGEGSVWVSHANSGLIYRVDPSSNTIIKRIDPGDPAAAMAVGKRAVWLLTYHKQVLRIDAASGTIAKRINLPGELSLQSCYGPATGPSVGELCGGITVVGDDVWVTAPLPGGVSATLWRIDSTKNRIAASIPLGCCPQGVTVDTSRLPSAVIVCGDDGTVYQVAADRPDVLLRASPDLTDVLAAYGSLWLTVDPTLAVSR